MTLTLTPDTETRLRMMAEGYGLNPAELHEDLLQQALDAAELELNETLAQLDESAEAIDAGRWKRLTRDYRPMQRVCATAGRNQANPSGT